jgi:hypothetical protein
MYLDGREVDIEELLTKVQENGNGAGPEGTFGVVKNRSTEKGREFWDHVESIAEQVQADPKPTYWRETDAAKLCNAAQEALFAVHRHMEKTLAREDWREVYGLRIKLGGIEERMRYAWDAGRD